MSDESLRTIMGRLKAVSAAKRKQLLSDGAASPPDTPLSPPACAYCNDRGWFTLPVGVEDPRIGKSYSCSCQAEKIASDRLRRLRIYSNLGSLTRFTFDALDDSRPAPANSCRPAEEQPAVREQAKISLRANQRKIDHHSNFDSKLSE